MHLMRVPSCTVQVPHKVFKMSKDKLPLICPLVFYHGSKKYDAPLNLWDLFDHPEEAKSLLGDNYQLVDLQAMSDDEINYGPVARWV